MRRELIAIIRGVRPDEVIGVADAILEAGINTIEVPLNSPDPFKSIQLLVEAFGRDALVGAGTVLKVEEVETLARAGSGLIVSPNCDVAVIGKTKSLGMKSFPGVLTPSECFAALEAGADGLKIFPASIAGPAGIAALRAVLPAGTGIYAVGGVGGDAGQIAQWLRAGATGFGIGSALYKPGSSVDEVAKAAKAFVNAYDQAVSELT